MSDNHSESPATDQAPATDEAPCTDCATSGEKILAVLAGAFAVFILIMAFDMFSGGRVTGLIRQKVDQ